MNPRVPFDRLYLTPACDLDFKAMYSYGTEGSMPGVKALEVLEALHKRDYPVFTVMLGKKKIGLVSMTSISSKHKMLTTTTYIRPGSHTPDISRTLKESARYAAKTAGYTFAIRVDKDNAKAIESMKKVWEDATATEDLDGSLLFTTHSLPRGYDAEMALYFRRALTKTGV
jgi:hypothetical protein